MFDTLQTFAQTAARATGVDRLLKRLAVSMRLKRQSPAEVFADIYRSNGWNGAHSVSGTGSDPTQTAALIRELPGLFRALEVRTILDVPCGDFHWMKHVDLREIHYVGGDIVTQLIQHNRVYETDTITFRRLDLLTDELPAVDLLLCRDCLVHLSQRDVWRALGNICRSGTRYLLTTTFPERKGNRDIVTGRWRPWNLERAPFRLPGRLRLLVEGCTEKGGKFKDKALGLWRTEDVRRALR